MSVSRRFLTATLAPLALLLGAMSATQESAVDAPAPAPEASASVEAQAAPDETAAGEGNETAEVEPGLVPPAPVPSRASAPPIANMRPLAPHEDWLSRVRLKDDRLVLKRSKKGEAGEVTLTLDPVLQSKLTQLLKSYDVPYGAAVALEPSTGRVLAMAEYSAAQPDIRGLTTRAVFPAASIFKIITGSALAEAGVSPDEETCFHGGKRRLSEKHLVDSARDGTCYSLARAMGLSANAVFAKLTHKHLGADDLRRMAARFRFNREIAFPFPTEVSLANIPDDAFGLANTGAGFGDVYLSPLHGALIASAAANGGLWRDPVFFEPEDPAAVAPAEPERILSPEAASALADMLEETVTRGTAHQVFRERGFRVDGAVGKTGTLADKRPFRDYSWFVGYAPKDNPRVAVAAVIVNGPLWRIRAPYVGREAIRLGLQRVPEPVMLTAPAGDVGGNETPSADPHPGPLPEGEGRGPSGA